jgi:predicted nucleotidyltransferase component of viral defense system
LVFKGGTSLSKAWRLIERFSEDLDLAIDREFFGFAGELGKNQRDKLKKKAGIWVDESFFPEIKARFRDRNIENVHIELVENEESDKDRIINIHYPNIFPAPGHLEPRVQIEITSRSLREPFTIRSFGSYIDEYYTDRDFTQPFIDIPVVNPERTFLEKIFLLHEEFHRPLEKIRVNRLSRHLYDVVKLSKTPFAEKALNDPGLYAAIVEHRFIYTRVGGVDYNLHQPQTIDPIPIPEIIKAWEADYQTMVERMIYEEYPPSFDSIIRELTALRSKINGLPWKFEKHFPIPGI